MRQYLLKNLFLSSLITVLLYSCSPASGYKLQGKTRLTESEIHPIIPKTGSVLFKAKIDLYSKHYSGLIVLKQTDSSIAHLTFVTEVGMKMFDYEIQNHRLNLVYIFEPLNKPNIIQVLTSDLSLMLLQNAYNQEAAVYTDSEKLIYKVHHEKKYYYMVNNKSIEKLTVKGGLFTKLKIEYKNNVDEKMETIELRHKGFFPLKMKLSSLPKENL